MVLFFLPGAADREPERVNVLVLLVLVLSSVKGLAALTDSRRARLIPFVGLEGQGL
jgi:hypothetical protein